MNPIHELAFVINRTKAGAPDLATDLVGIATAAGVRVRQTTEHPLPADFLKGCDACCVIGGDGTLLGVVADACREQIPVIGVNRGSLGFLTTFSMEEARAQFTGLLAGHFVLAPRLLLECRGGNGRPELALNDVVIKSGASSRLVLIGVRADGELVTEYFCDGLVVSTATGSTAYNLAAGGPIIHPSADVVALTPICPHTLSNRSLVLRRDVRLEILPHSPGNRLQVAVDGRPAQCLAENDPVSIQAAPLPLLLAQSTDYSHFRVLRTKLQWSGGVSRG